MHNEILIRPIARWNKGINNEYISGKNVEGSGHGLL
jgi:hypothetical protein